MAFLNIQTPQLDTLRAQVQDARNTWAQKVQRALDEQAEKGVYALKTKAPQGKGDVGNAVPGDAPGSLALSFTQEPFTGNPGTIIRTSQGNKLRFIRFGTGLYGPLGHRIVPTHAKALYWQGAAHPYRSIAGQKPNDFVTPVVEDTLQQLDQAARQTTRDLLAGWIQ